MEPSDKELLQDSFANEPKGPAANETVEVEVTDSPSDRPRDDQGRFVKAEDTPRPEPVTTAPPQAVPQEPQADHRVPLRELLDEREKRQQAAQESERLRAQNEYMNSLLMQRSTPTQQPTQAPPAADISSCENPDAFLAARIDPYWQQARAEIMNIRQQLAADKEAISRERAVEKFGEATVDAAFAELAQQMQMGQAQHDYQRIMSSAHPFGELVRWHQQQTNFREVGADPNAWLEKKLEERMNDPAFQAKVIERARNGSQQ